MRRFYNQSEAMRGRGPRFDHAFWEVSVDQDVLNGFVNEKNPNFASEEDLEAQLRRDEWVSEILPIVLDLIEEALTEKQREIVRLYFFDQLTEQEVATRLNISVPSVSQHLFGKSRGAKKVGGAVPKLRKKLIQQVPNLERAEGVFLHSERGG